MKKLKVFLAGASAFAMMMPMAMTGVSAAEVTGGGDTDVVYDNTNVIPDPENPTDAKWGISVPSSIQFKDDKKIIAADVELVTMNGNSNAQAVLAKKTEVRVASANEFKMALADGTDEVAYDLVYDGAAVVNNAVVLNLAAGVKPSDPGTKNEGKAILKGTATKQGAHKDKLTYTVAVIQPAP